MDDEFITIKIKTELDILNVRRYAKEFARKLEFKENNLSEIEIIISELGSNIIKHTEDGGIITLKKIENGNIKGIEITCSDKGSGIEDIEKALSGNFSTKNTLGLGLSSIKRLADEFYIKKNDEDGFKIGVKKWIDTKYEKLNASVISVPKFGEKYNGDTFFLKQTIDYLFICLIDVLGHGQEASEIAKITENIITNNYYLEIDKIVNLCHKRLLETRGCVIAITKIYPNKNKIENVSIGNIQTNIYTNKRVKVFQSINGIIGFGENNIKINYYDEYKKGNTIVMYSDGIHSNMNLESDILRKTPQEISTHILKNYGKSYDDATIIVAK